MTSTTTDGALGSARELIRHIVDRFHRTLRDDLASLDRAFETAPPDDTLEALYATFAGLRDELLMHMRKEEQILFPHIAELEASVESGVLHPALHPGLARGIVSVMMREHAGANLALVGLRRISGDFEAPGDAGDAKRSIYARLAAVDEDLRRHIALEDDVLFPRALELERSLPRP